MGTGIKPGWDPDEAREIVEEQRRVAETRDGGSLALARRYARSSHYTATRAMVYDLKLEGYENHEIATLVSAATGRAMTLAKVDAMIRSAIHDQQQTTIEEKRAIEGARLDVYLVAMKDKIGAGETRAISRALEISKRRAALEGLDAPVRIHAHLSADVDPALLAQAEDARRIADEAISQRYPMGIEDAEVVPDEDDDDAPSADDPDGGFIDMDLAPDIPEDEL